MQVPPGYQTSVAVFPQGTNPQSGFISFPAIPTTFGATPFTIASWLRSFGIDTPLGDNVISIQDGANTITLLQNGAFVSRPRLEAVWSNASIQIDGDFDAWHFIAMTWDGTWLVLWVDGVPAGQAIAQPAPVSNPVFQIGYENPPNAPGSFNGYVRTFEYWNAVLTPDQIVAQMWSQVPVVTEGLLSFCDFTTDVPTVIAGPTPAYVGIDEVFPLILESFGLYSQGTDVALPGQDSSLNPSAAAPFSILAWVAPGDLTATAAIPELPPADPSHANGCIFSNGDSADPGNMAISLVAGVPTVTFGNGAAVKSSQQISRYMWSSIAVVYDGSLCTLFVNGSLAGKGIVSATPAPAPKPALLGQFQNSAPVNGFTGMLQSLSVWSVALSAAEASWYLENDPSTQLGCVANFVCSMDPPQDLVSLDDAIWGDNLILLGSGMSWQRTQLIAPDPSPSPRLTMPPFHSVQEQTLPPIVRIRVPRVKKTSAGSPSEAGLREHMRRDFQRAASAIGSDRARARLSAEFERQLDVAFRRRAAGGIPDLCTIAESGGSYTVWLDTGERKTRLATVASQPVIVGKRTEHLLTFRAPSGEVLARLQVDVSASCFLWWVSFAVSLITGALMIMGLPNPTDKIMQIIKDMLKDVQLLAVLATMEGLASGAMVAGNVLYFLKIVYDFGYLGELVKAVISQISWWAAVQILARIIALVTPVPTPEKALFIARAAVLVLQLVAKLVDYPMACGSEAEAA